MTESEKWMVDQLGGGGQKKLDKIRKVIEKIEMDIPMYEEGLSVFQELVRDNRADAKYSIEECVQFCKEADELIERCRIYNALMKPLSYPEERKQKFLRVFSELESACISIQSLNCDATLNNW